MYKAELPAGWSTQISREYQRRAAKPPSDAEVAQEREAVLGRLRRDWGDATDAKLAQVRALVHGLGDDRLIETLNRSGLGNDEWLIRQVAIHTDRKAAKAVEEGKSEGSDGDAAGEAASSVATSAPYRDIAYRPHQGVDIDGASLDTKPSAFVQLADKSGDRTNGRDEADGDSGGFLHSLFGKKEENRPRAVIVDTPDGPYLMRRTWKGKIITQPGTSAHRWSREQVKANHLYYGYPPSVDEAKAIQERLDRGETLDAPTRGSAEYPRAGHSVAVQYPNGDVHYLRNAKGEYLYSPGREDLVIPVEQAIALGLGDWGIIPPPNRKEKPVPPLPPTTGPEDFRTKRSRARTLAEWTFYELQRIWYKLQMETYNQQDKLYTKQEGSGYPANVPTDQD